MDKYENVYADFAKTLVTRHGARAHWGKNRRDIFLLEKQRNTFGDNLGKFQQIVAETDPNGMFANQYGVDMGLHWPHMRTAVPINTEERPCLAQPLPEHACRTGWEKSGALCYPACRPGFHGVGPVCWSSCPAGFHDDGATCRKDAHIIGSDNKHCPGYDKCGLVTARGCSKCPSGYHNDGCTCRQDAQITAKQSYGRGVGEPPQ